MVRRSERFTGAGGSARDGLRQLGHCLSGGRTRLSPGSGKKEVCSFLKKRTKKLFSFG
jgi:hypothetical protein